MASNDLSRAAALITSEGAKKEEVKPRIDEYEKHFTEGSIETRKEAYMSQVNTFYDLSTTFIEYAWGKSFHFAPAFKGETFEASIARYEHRIAVMLGLKKGMTVIDVGCGVGGPGRSIARFSGAKVIGINNNEYQLGRARKLSEEANLSQLCTYKQTDFMKLAECFPPNSLDGAFAIEAIAHAPDKKDIYSQIYKLLKPGAYFVTAEWVMLPAYDKNNKAHALSKHLIEKGNGIVDLESHAACLQHFKDAGFEVVEAVDWAEESEENWYKPLDFNLTPQGLMRSRPGHYITHVMLSTMECLRLAPPGSVDVSRILMETGQGLVDGGRMKTFTPMFMLWGRKKL